MNILRWANTIINVAPSNVQSLAMVLCDGYTLIIIVMFCETFAISETLVGLEWFWIAYIYVLLNGINYLACIINIKPLTAKQARYFACDEDFQELHNIL